MLDSMVVLCKRPGEKEYAPIGRVALQDANSAKGAAYTFTDIPENGTNQYRIAIYPVGNAAPNYSNTATALVISQKAVWNDVTNNYVANAGFDQSADYQQANLGTGTSNHKAVTGWTTNDNNANGCSAAFEIGSGKQLNGSTSTTNPYLFFDYIKLEKVTTKDEYIATGITSPTADPQARPIEIYDLNGIRLPSPRRGVNIVKYSDGSVKKILVE